MNPNANSVTGIPHLRLFGTAADYTEAVCRQRHGGQLLAGFGPLFGVV